MNQRLECIVEILDMLIVHRDLSEALAYNLISIPPLFVIIVRIIVDHIEKSKLIDTLRSRDNAQPVPQLLFLEELLRSKAIVSAMSRRMILIYMHSQILQISP